MSALAGRSGRNLLLYGGALLLTVVVGATIAYSQEFLGDSGPYLLVVALLGVVVAGAILWQWRLGALLLVATLPYGAIISYATVGTFGALTSGIKVLALLTFASLALALLMDRELFERFVRLWQQPLAVAVLVFVLWVAASILWASDEGKALRETVTYLGLIGLMAAIGLLERRYLLLAWAGLALSAALSVPAAAILPLPEGSDMAVSGRFGPGGAGPNTYSLIMAIAFFVAYFGWLRKHRMIAYLLAPIFLFAIFATQSRTGLIALVATPLLALFVPRLAARLGGWRILPMYVLGTAALAAILLAVPAVGGDVAERYQSLSQIQSEDTWNGRLSNWGGAYQVIVNNPLVGVGAGNYAEAAFYYSQSVQRHSDVKASEAGELAGATHNVFLGVASELGLVGLILFLGILFFAFRTALPIARRSDLGTGIFLGLIVATIGGMTQPWEEEKTVFVLYGSVLALQLYYSARRAPSSAGQEGSR